MEAFARFLEKIHVGTVIDPHTERKTVLVEMVTVCPSCRSLHSLRHEGNAIYCAECLWSTTTREPAHAA